MSRGAETKINILEAAVKLAGYCGIQGLTIGSLAKIVGMSKSGLFAHFQSKENLQVMVIEMATKDFTQKVLSQAFKEPRGEPRVVKILENWIEYLSNEKTLHGGKVLIESSIEMNSRPGPVRNFIQKAQKDLMLNIQKAAEIAVSEGHFRKNLDCKLFAWSVYSLVLGYFHSKKMLDDPQAETYLNKKFKDLIELSKEQKGKTENSYGTI